MVSVLPTIPLVSCPDGSRQSRLLKIRISAWPHRYFMRRDVVRSASPSQYSFIEALHRRPVDRRHERADVVTGFGAVIYVIGMLVHIEREDRRSAGQRVAMIRRPLIDELAVSRRPGQQHPAGAAAKRLAHRDEFQPPSLIGAEIAGKRIPKRRGRLAFVAQAVEKQLMQ